MIRTDLGNRIQPTADPALRPALPSQDLAEKLSGLVVGQRLLAEVESLLPNGTYRAMVNQRAVTLALPFAAKSGDVLELEVAESDGKLTLAVVARQGTGSLTGGEAAATNLSRTGQLIGTLLAGSRDVNTSGGALPLNGNQPISAKPPLSGRELQPLLQQAIVESGMFYESHQADWVEGRYSKAQLLQEPQGKLPPQVPPAAYSGAAPASLVDSSALTADSAPEQTATRENSARPAAQPAQIGGSPQSPADFDSKPLARLAQGEETFAVARGTGTRQDALATPASTTPSATAEPVAPQAQALVQQQLEAFATQNFVWQGQVWPGQPMEWQIEDSGQRRDQATDASNERWQTRLSLTLPTLGEIEARLQVQGQQIVLALTAGEAETRTRLQDASAALRAQFSEVGLDLSSFAIAVRERSRNEDALDKPPRPTS